MEKIHPAIKYACLAVLAIILIIGSMVVYRMYFMFDKKKLKACITDAANTSTDPEKAAQLITDGVEFILKSSDLTAQAKLLSEIDGIDKELALVNMAVQNCYSSGLISRPTESEA